MRQKIYFLLPILLLLLFAGCSNGGKLNKELNAMAERLNQSAPAQLDEHTIFLGSHVTGNNVFQYSYQIVNSENPDSLMLAVEKQTRASIREAFQLNPDLKIFTVNNLNIEYIYSDSTGSLLRKIEITPEDYK